MNRPHIIIIIVFLSMLNLRSLVAAESNHDGNRNSITGESNKKTIIQYQKYQKIDLGALSVDGDVVLSTDVNVNDENLSESLDIYRRSKFVDKINDEIKGIR
ncbi:MAG: hypothetical protein HQK52_21450 [Oligoflexia bacterium]|nr:hypothetical protein [Oligoflexia bacterium]